MYEKETRMKISRLKIFFACVLSILLIFTATACERGETISMDAVYEANLIKNVTQTHKTIKSEFAYYENMDGVITYNTFYSYSESGNLDDGPVYVALGADMLDSTSADNFRYAVVDNIEYYRSETGSIIVYLLHPDYMQNFPNTSIALFNNSFGKIKSAEHVEDNLIITTESKAADVYGEATVQTLSGLCKDGLSTVEVVYTVNGETLLLQEAKTYFVSDEGTKYLFSEEKVTYGGDDPDLSFIDGYRNAPQMRNVTIIEKTAKDEIPHTYSIPSTVSPNYQSFISSKGYLIYADATLTAGFGGEWPDEFGIYAPLTVYAGPAENLVKAPTETMVLPDAANSDQSDTDAQQSGTSDGSADTEQPAA